MGWYSSYEWRPYVPVAERRYRAAKKITKMKKDKDPGTKKTSSTKPAVKKKPISESVSRRIARAAATESSG